MQMIKKLLGLTILNFPLVCLAQLPPVVTYVSPEVVNQVIAAAPAPQIVPRLAAAGLSLYYPDALYGAQGARICIYTPPTSSSASEPTDLVCTDSDDDPYAPTTYFVSTELDNKVGAAPPPPGPLPTAIEL